MERSLLIGLTGLVLAAAPALANPGFWRDGGESSSTEAIVAEMSIRELVGQTLMIGYSGLTPSDELLEFLLEAGIGGVKVFGWNSGNLSELARGIGVMQETAARSATGVPLLVATDQEGGWVRHVKGATSDTPGNLAIGASGLPLDAYENAMLIGRELAVLGINMNFAPTVDVYIDPDADVIGPRAFSEDPVQTALLALAFFRGLERVGIIATAKHFPGHGNTSADSHGTLPVITDSLEEIWDRDLLPYRMLVPEGLPAIMSGHLSFPTITGESVPATLSPRLLQELLRNELGFEGVIITDDMRMYGVLQSIEVEEASELAILAGNDMIMISQDLDTQRSVFDHLVRRATIDPALESALRRSALRIVGLKLRYFGNVDPERLLPLPEEVYSRIPDREGEAALFDLICRSVTVARSASIPFTGATGDGGRDLLLVGQYGLFISEGRRRFPNAETLALPSSTLKPSETRRLVELAGRAERIVFYLSDEESLEVLRELEGFGAKVTVFSVLTPVYLRRTPWVTSAIATYGRSIESFRAGFAVLSGDYVAEGVAPISLEPLVE